jgi:hypothetical protein
MLPMVKVDQNFLEHYGILGMRWGVRRSRRELSSGPSKSPGSKDYQEARALKRKRIKDMTNEELSTFTKRIRLEQEYRKVTKATKGKGRKLVEEALLKIAKQTLEKAADSVSKQLMKKMASRAARAAA